MIISWRSKYPVDCLPSAEYWVSGDCSRVQAVIQTTDWYDEDKYQVFMFTVPYKDPGNIQPAVNVRPLTSVLSTWTRHGSMIGLTTEARLAVYCSHSDYYTLNHVTHQTRVGDLDIYSLYICVVHIRGLYCV